MNVPVSLDVSVTWPVGVMNVPVDLSVIVTVHVVAAPKLEGSLHVTVTAVDLRAYVMVRVTVGSGLAAR